IKEKRFIVSPSKYVIDYIYKNITEPYVRGQVEKVFKETEIQEDQIRESTIDRPQQISTPQKTIQVSSAEPSEDQMCPSCKARLIITEGCNMCIECGFSSCVSG
ncbi:MAG TPA: ribonucleoside-diphosphate reductase, adenosylcobalamin-dependent, partial [Nitrososphaeraceae archaeon]|nr:ribonucleoside-diphosphate reductase, adenosylcobalamin-dependent [Nitrososphaeraceae archaeon]